jgi:hypothetical protein
MTACKNIPQNLRINKRTKNKRIARFNRAPHHIIPPLNGVPPIMHNKRKPTQGGRDATNENQKPTSESQTSTHRMPDEEEEEEEEEVLGR